MNYKALVQIPGKEEDVNKHRSYFIFREPVMRKKKRKKPTKRIITSPLAIENSLAESEVFGRGLRTMK